MKQKLILGLILISGLVAVWLLEDSAANREWRRTTRLLSPPPSVDFFLAKRLGWNAGRRDGRAVRLSARGVLETLYRNGLEVGTWRVWVFERGPSLTLSSERIYDRGELLETRRRPPWTYTQPAPSDRVAQQLARLRDAALGLEELESEDVNSRALRELAAQLPPGEGEPILEEVERVERVNQGKRKQYLAVIRELEHLAKEGWN